ncbi:MAG: hypothetical protein ITG00_09490 [Flavobacterium sp.]|nr:hypothetical protein [Flavobacterium sp.]
MKINYAASPKILKATARIENIEDLFEEDSLQNVYWTERALSKAMPKAGIKVKKMKSR